MALASAIPQIPRVVPFKEPIEVLGRRGAPGRPRDCDAYLASFRSFRLEGFILAPASGLWKLTRRRLGPCVLEHGAHAAPFVASGTTARARVTFAFAASAGSGLRVQEREVSRDTICRWPGGAGVSLVASRPTEWFVVTVADADLAAIEGGKVAGFDDADARRSVLYEAPTGSLDRIRSLLLRLLGAGDGGGPADRSPGGPERVERALVAELVRMTAGPPLPLLGDGSPRIARHPVLEQISSLFAARLAEPVYVADLCRATGLPERTLRHIVAEQFGTSPMRLLRCRRLGQLRRCLQAGDDGGESLTLVASRHGFRHMGTLASDYRRLFGELPSETRRRPAGSVPAPIPPSWQVASRSVSDSGP